MTTNKKPDIEKKIEKLNQIEMILFKVSLFENLDDKPWCAMYASSYKNKRTRIDIRMAKEKTYEAIDGDCLVGDKLYDQYLYTAHDISLMKISQEKNH